MNIFTQTSNRQSIPAVFLRRAVAAIFFCYGLCFASWASRIPDIQELMGLSEAELGGVLFALPLGALISLPLSGFLVAKMNSRSVVIFSALLYPVSLICIGFSLNVEMLLLSLFIFGLLGNMLNISINTQAVGVEAIYERNIMAGFHGMWSLAGFAGAGVGALMIAWQIPPWEHYLILTLVVVLLVLVAGRYLLARDVNRGPGKPMLALPGKPLLLLGMIVFCSMLCEGAMFDWSGVYFKKVVSVDSDQVGIGYTVFMISMAATRFLADRLVGALGLNMVLQWSGVFTASGLLLTVLFPDLLISSMGFLLIGVGVSSVVPLVFSKAGRSSKQSAGIAIASVSTMGFFGFLFGPPLIGMIAELTSLRISFAVLILPGIGIALLSRFLK